MLNLKQIEEIVNDGGFLRFTWLTCRKVAVDKNGAVHLVDGRAYHAFLRKHEGKLTETRTGYGLKNLVIEWKKAQ